MAIKSTTPSRLILESHPLSYDGLPFLTLLEYHKSLILAIIDNVDKDIIKAYVLDSCAPELIPEHPILEAAIQWHEQGSKIPLSIFFSKHGLTPITSRIYKHLPMEWITRVIGPMPSFPLDVVKPVKRRRRKQISPTIEIISVIV